MSELKARKFFEAVPTSKEGFYQPGAFVNGYLKYEADKVIAEMKKACNDKDEWCLHTLKENRHHKYKRCKAMAYIEWLKQMTLCYYSQSVLYRRAYRRERKWKELAEKFKPNKSTAQ